MKLSTKLLLAWNTAFLLFGIIMWNAMWLEVSISTPEELLNTEIVYLPLWYTCILIYTINCIKETRRLNVP